MIQTNRMYYLFAILASVTFCTIAQPKGAKKGGHGFTCPDIVGSQELKISTQKPTVLIFYSDTCSACTDAVAPFNNFVRQTQDAVTCLSVNTSLSENEDITKLLKVTSVPTTVVIHQHVGVGPLEGFLTHATGFGRTGSASASTEPIIEEEAEEIIEEVPATRAHTDIPLSVKPEDIAPIVLEDEIVTKRAPAPAPARPSRSSQRRSARSTSRK